MVGYGTHSQPPGTWSDDSSLMFCLIESLCVGYDVEDIAKKFVKWYGSGYWTPYGRVFDIGNATLEAIHRLQQGCEPIKAGGKTEYDNGNGSLMRILPLGYYLLEEKDVEIRFNIVKDVSSITHAHLRSIMACFIYTEIAIALIKGKTLNNAIDESRCVFELMFKDNPEKIHFKRILDMQINRLPEKDIYSSGYVIHSLEASLWCLYNSKSYKEAVLMAVNLGDDTDTTAAITGGLAGIIFGEESIPLEWIDLLARKHDILKLCKAFYQSVSFK
jgi:ADP-ribosyl-[dinitrogen reductase] hydrolase